MSSRDVIVFEVPGTPVHLARHRTRPRKSASGVVYAQQYDPKENVVGKAAVAQAAMVAMTQSARGRRPFEGPVLLWVRFEIVQPQAKRFKRPQRIDPARLLRCSYPITKPDLSNEIKLIEDACNGITYVDDAQICQYDVRANYVRTAARTVVAMRELDMDDTGWTGFDVETVKTLWRRRDA